MTEPNFIADPAMVEQIVRNGFDRKTKLNYNLTTITLNGGDQCNSLKVSFPVGGVDHYFMDWTYFLPLDEEDYIKDANSLHERVKEFNKNPEYHWSLTLERPLRQFRDRTASRIQELQEILAQSQDMIFDIYDNFRQVEEERRA